MNRSDRLWLGASAAIAALGVFAKLHSITVYPAIYDWDAGGHALNVVDLLEGRWPDPRSWCGSHPPLFYALSAALSLLLSESVAIHVLMRAISVTAFLAAVALVWRTLRPRIGVADSSVVGTLLVSLPGFTIASCMMTNDALCALFVTATLARMTDAPAAEPPSWKHAVLTGVCAGLAALSKATGMAALGMGGAYYAWRSRRALRRGLPAVIAFGLTAFAIAGPHYARLFVTVSGSPYDILGARAGSGEKEAIATVVHGIAAITTGGASYPGLLHAALWSDPTAVFLPHGAGSSPLGRALWFGGILVVALAAAGVVRLASSPELRRAWGAPLVFGMLYTLALTPHAVDRPYIVLTKTNYLMPQVLPLGMVLAAGLRWRAGTAGALLRGLLLTIALGGVAFTAHGWWLPAPKPSGVDLDRAADGAPVETVERYLRARADDPVRALQLLDSQVQLAHELRLARILGVPLPGSQSRDDAVLALARARVAWLEIYNLIRWSQPIAASLDVDVIDVREAGDGAEVHVRIAAQGEQPPPGAEIGLWPFPPFEERVTLTRRHGRWWVTGVEQIGVRDENAVQAFVAHPTQAGLDHLRSIGWQPPWETVIRSIVGRPG